MKRNTKNRNTKKEIELNDLKNKNPLKNLSKQKILQLKNRKK